MEPFSAALVAAAVLFGSLSGVHSQINITVTEASAQASWKTDLSVEKYAITVNPSKGVKVLPSVLYKPFAKSLVSVKIIGLKSGSPYNLMRTEYGVNGKVINSFQVPFYTRPRGVDAHGINISRVTDVSATVSWDRPSGNMEYSWYEISVDDGGIAIPDSINASLNLYQRRSLLLGLVPRTSYTVTITTKVTSTTPTAPAKAAVAATTAILGNTLQYSAIILYGAPATRKFSTSRTGTVTTEATPTKESGTGVGAAGAECLCSNTPTILSIASFTMSILLLTYVIILAMLRTFADKQP
ncbi:uncharacterized protein LOC135498905 [Lineus longissimus]|uniref:uncharacterized protein LOC135498905 n=1 Tax=Lineus longissimus TaxID=88925 RepID=UPI002B4E82A0